MDVYFELNGLLFVRDADKDSANAAKHDGVSFRQAATVFFDPFLLSADASRNEEERVAAIGYDDAGRLLFVVHVEVGDEAIRVISARKATILERRQYEHS